MYTYVCGGRWLGPLGWFTVHANLSGGQMFVRDQELLGAWTPASNGDEHDGWSQPVWLASGTGAYANAFVPTVS